MKNGSKKRRLPIQFTLDYWMDDDWYIGRLREVPSVMSQGESLDELIENIRDAYSLVVRESRKSIPAGNRHSKKVSFVF